MVLTFSRMAIVCVLEAQERISEPESGLGNVQGGKRSSGRVLLLNLPKAIAIQLYLWKIEERPPYGKHEVFET